AVCWHGHFMTHAMGIVQKLVKPLWICLAHADIAQVCAEPRGPQINLRIEHVIPRHCSPRTPLSVNIVPFIFLPDILAMTIETAVCRIHSGPLGSRLRVSHRSQRACGVILALTQSGKCQVGVSHEPEPGNPEKKKNAKKESGYFVHATLTSASVLSEASFDCSVAIGRTLTGADIRRIRPKIM